MRVIKFLNVAKKLASKSEHKHKLGCVIAKGNKILGLGFNSVKTHTKSQHPFKTLHAECSALISAGLEDTQGAVAYVYRATKDGKEAMSLPCIYCKKMLAKAGIHKVYYTKSEYPYWEELKIYE